MDHYRCFTVFNPKTKKSSIVNTFHWSECNKFSCPKITSEEQITNAAKELAQAIKSKSFLHLPDKNLRTKVEDLCTIFQETADNIITKKLSPLALEPHHNDNNPSQTDQTSSRPRVNKSTDDNISPISSTLTNDDDSHPRVKSTTVNLSYMIQ